MISVDYRVKTYLTFGPVPSRRLGRSLGINNVPAKRCTYSCVYCQLGYKKTRKPVRKEFFKPEKIANSLEKKIQKKHDLLENVDFITIVPNGEPTLDLNLGRLIKLLRKFNVPLAILTNGSLLWKEDVRNELSDLDLVSIKVDAVKEQNWRLINCPNEYLHQNKILAGVLDFSEDFNGKIITETMLIDSLDYDFVKLGEYLKKIKNLHKSYITIPTRPPSFPWVRPADETTITDAYQALSELLGKNRIELMLGFEGSDFYFSGDIEKDILSITSIHPIREKTLKEILTKLNYSWDVVENLIREKKLSITLYNKEYFFLRNINQKEK